MRRTLAITSLLIAWLCANGALLDVAQIIAWSRMFAGYTQSMSVAAALRETFDPAKPCEMCRAVAAAKQSEAAQSTAPVDGERGAEKLLLAFHSPAKIIFTASPKSWPDALTFSGPNRSEPVPVPPPRA